MGVLAVAGRLGERAPEGAEPGRLIGAETSGHPVRDGRVVGRGARERLLGQSPAQRAPDGTVIRFQRGENGRVIRHVGHDGDVGVVLGRRADHRRAADIDVLDAIGIRPVGRDGRLERVEVDHQKVDRADPVCGERRLVLGVVADGEQAAVHRRMQGLHPAVHHLGEARQVGDLRHRKPGLLQGAVRPARRDQRDAARMQRAGKVDEAGLVRDREERAGDPHQIVRHSFVPKSVSPAPVA